MILLLLLFLLLLHVLVLLVVVVAVTPAAFSQSRSVRKSPNRWCRRIFVIFSGQNPPKKHRKYRCFCASEAQYHGIYYGDFCFVW